MPSLTIAHFSDIHLALPEGRPALGHLLSKRLLSYISWRRSRHRIHRRTVVDALLADVRAHAPDHVAVTGDLVNLSLPAEFAAARQWLETVGPPGRVTVVPGNHDALVPVPWADGLGRWQEWMQGDDAPPGPDAFPFVRVRGQVALVGVRSAVPTAPLLATGHIGQTQADRLSAILDDLGRRGLFRILLVHHPVHRAGESRRKALDDGERLTAVIARSGIELLLHGHGHVGRLDSLVGPAAPIASLGCSSASALPSHHGEAARWHLLTITRTDRGWEANVVVRRLDGTGTGFATVGRYRLDIPAPLNI
ncbi:3',5'-cyclic AMP phosphodiesterase CpdA [Stella humosa]|uniref:3',5'-cyclic AMP phosphodiesterase CpdA n=1 Tax=Stella humosa TaxID=94 RepID=A0A3N1M9K8_9PROT|nr:metallophosphoesterase [Stella humosa]ROQ00328.1 3',5'-cyclic AMP phosphodiesterase CpdA [Stella humosa]BBK30433.1 metallophosphoesterase [Stella humosa]